MENSTMFSVSVKSHPYTVTAGYVVTWQHQYGPGLPCAVKLLKGCTVPYCWEELLVYYSSLSFLFPHGTPPCFYSSLTERYCVF